MKGPRDDNPLNKTGFLACLVRDRLQKKTQPRPKRPMFAPPDERAFTANVFNPTMQYNMSSFEESPGEIHQRDTPQARKTQKLHLRPEFGRQPSITHGGGNRTHAFPKVEVAPR